MLIKAAVELDEVAPRVTTGKLTVANPTVNVKFWRTVLTWDWTALVNNVKLF